MIKKFSLLILLFAFFVSFSQSTINNYEYIVVPVKFDFLDKNDQYRLNTKTRFIFKDMGFTVFYDVEEPSADLFANKCLAVYADVKELKGGFLKTKLQVELRDCKGNMVVISKVGESRKKDFEASYKEALDDAFSSIKAMDYKYNSKTLVNNTKSTMKLAEIEAEKSQKTKAEVKRLQQEIKALKEEKKEIKATVAKIDAELKPKNDKVLKTKDIIVNQKETLNLLYAQEIESGFQLVDSEPKKIMILLTTAAQNIYAVKGKDAIVFKENGQWIYSENKESSMLKKVLNIKF